MSKPLELTYLEDYEATVEDLARVQARLEIVADLGELASAHHPKLLDRAADELVESGWEVEVDDPYTDEPYFVFKSSPRDALQVAVWQPAVAGRQVYVGGYSIPRPRARLANSRRRSSSRRTRTVSRGSPERPRPGDDPEPEHQLAELVVGRRLWAVFAIALTVDVAESILRGRPVMIRGLDPEALRRALRGTPAPPPDSFVRVRHGHLDALDECGPLLPERRAAA